MNPLCKIEEDCCNLEAFVKGGIFGNKSSCDFPFQNANFRPKALFKTEKVNQDHNAELSHKVQKFDNKQVKA